MAAMRWLPRPEAPSAGYLGRVRRELPRPLASLVLGPVAPGVRMVDRRLPTPGHAVRVRVYRPPAAAEGLLPLVVNLHGGGFVFGSLTGADWLCSHVAARAGVLVVSVDYRLAPEHQAPGPYEDALAATTWLLDHAAEVGGDASRASLMGESAGGNLAALVTLALRDRRRADPSAPGLVGQVLLYPATDLTLSSPSVDEFPEAPMLRRSSMEWYGRQYVPQGLATSIAPEDPRVSPLLAPDHTDLPPALVVGAGLDPLRDDAAHYAEALAAAGVPVHHVLYPGALHGFASIPLFEAAAREVLVEIEDHLRTVTPPGRP